MAALALDTSLLIPSFYESRPMWNNRSALQARSFEFQVKDIETDRESEAVRFTRSGFHHHE